MAHEQVQSPGIVAVCDECGRRSLLQSPTERDADIIAVEALGWKEYGTEINCYICWRLKEDKNTIRWKEVSQRVCSHHWVNGVCDQCEAVQAWEPNHA